MAIESNRLPAFYDVERDAWFLDAQRTQLLSQQQLAQHQLHRYQLAQQQQMSAQMSPGGFFVGGLLGGLGQLSPRPGQVTWQDASKPKPKRAEDSPYYSWPEYLGMLFAVLAGAGFLGWCIYLTLYFWRSFL